VVLSKIPLTFSALVDHGDLFVRRARKTR